jgi:hypothetical protein
MTEPSSDGPTIAAELIDGPLRGRSIHAPVVQGRPPSTLEVAADDGTTCRYCLTQLPQGGPSARYSFLYRV